jgi:hypothetical protein
VLQVDANQHHISLLREIANQGYPSGFTAGVHLEFNGLNVALGPILQNDRERRSAVNGGTSC